jgi:TM2 domain-containing membrane protein YozV
MKKSLTIYTLLFAFLAFSFNTNASFPVKKKTETIEIIKGDKIEKTEVTTFSSLASSGKSQVTALILVILIGTLGIHRFYLGYTWQGVVQLLTLGGLGVWALIDLIRIITGDLQPKDGSYSTTL